jgi:hypothetical protein
MHLESSVVLFILRFGAHSLRHGVVTHPVPDENIQLFTSSSLPAGSKKASTKAFVAR